MGTLSVIATPIGNLEDMTLRAIRILGEVDHIFAEDTRVTRGLLTHFNISKPLSSYNAHASEATHEKVIALLGEGKNVALVSDAGTPGISDPGCMLVAQVRAALPQAKIVAVPGASALTAALSISGIPASEFLFLGFLPHKKGRETLFKEIALAERPVVFYESPHRILKTLASLAEHAPTKKVSIFRELTKIYEEVQVGIASELLAHFEKNPGTVRGEFVVLVEPL